MLEWWIKFMVQLDLFEYQAPKSHLFLLKGNNFLLLPPKKSLFELREILAAGFFLLAFVMNLNLSPAQPDILNQKAVLGVLTTQQPEIAQASTEQNVAPGPPPVQTAGSAKPIPKPVPIEKVYVPVLMYHHVGEPPTNNALDRSLTVSTADFEEQVVFLKNYGYQSVTIAAVYSALERGTALPSKPIVFTFDDGYKDVFDNAVPILKKHGMIGTFAISPALLGKQPYASWGEVLKAYQEGMEIVSHSMNHVDFSSSVYSDDFLMIELEGSKLFLESRISSPVNFFVYPYGKYNARAIELVKKAGYKMAFTTELGTEMNLNDAYRLPRVRVHGQDGLIKLKRILGL